MSAVTFLLEPVDAWFFRDGRPYNKEESNQVDVESTFPPSAATIVGSIRAALARARGWNGTRRWPDNLAAVLGDGFENLGQLSFSGPWLARRSDRGTGYDFLFTAPLQLLGKIENKRPGEPRWKPAALLAPGKSVLCDLGDVRLPAPTGRDNVAGLKEPTGQWLTPAGFEQVLRGKLPEAEDVVAGSGLWRHEFRVGLVRNESTRTTDEQALYSNRYVRLCRGISLAIAVSGIPPDWSLSPKFPLGGKGAWPVAPTASSSCPCRQRPQVPSARLAR